MKALLTTLHAKYVHASLALPCLAAACTDIPGLTIAIREFTINEPHDQVLRSLVQAQAEIVAFSCYIWNIEQTLKLAGDLKKVNPETVIILGGPESGFGVCELLESNPAVDGVIRGEGEITFRELLSAAVRLGPGNALHEVEEGMTFRNGGDFVILPERPALADLNEIPSPFAAGLADLGKPLVYLETSRGCPFSCAYCMSSLDRTVRSFSLPRMERDLLLLMEQGPRTIKLVDRTFNYDSVRANHIWEYILKHNRSSAFHFEIAADLLTEENLRLLRDVPEGMFRFEIGVQSENEATLARVGRKSDLRRLFANVARLREETSIVLHLDLVAGLPHEDFTGFGESLQALFDARPHHIQVEPLKVLKGSPMRRIAADEEYAFSDFPPYKILRTPWLSFAEITRIEIVSRLVDLYYNSGKFAASLAALERHATLSEFFTLFASYWEAESIPAGLSQTALFDLLHRFLIHSFPGHLSELHETLSFDYCRAEFPVTGRLPSFFSPPPSGEALKERINEQLRNWPTPPGSKVRTFTCSFSRDYRTTPWKNLPVHLLFLYISTPGRKMKVEATPL